MSNQTPLYSALVQHHRLGRSAFHTPGHSGKPISQLNHLLQLDVTELPDTNLSCRIAGARSRQSTRFYKRNVMLHKYLGQHVPYFLPEAALYVFRQCCVLFRLTAIKKQF